MPQNIVIVGGGIIGAATAYFLVNHELIGDAKVFLIESSEIAAGASGKAGGLVSKDMHSRATKDLGKYSFKVHQDLAQKHDGANVWGYRPVETLELEGDISRPNLNQKRSLHESLNWLDPAVTMRYSVISGPESTVQVHPKLLTCELIRLACINGLTVIKGNVTGLDRNEDGLPTSIIYQYSDKNTTIKLPTSQVIFASGPWTGRLAKSLLSSEEAEKCSVSGARVHSIVLAAADLPPVVLFTEIKSVKGTVDPEIFCRPDGTAYVGGHRDKSILPSSVDDVQVEPEAIAMLYQQAQSLSSLFKDAEIRKRQACYLPTSERGLPIIGSVSRGIWIGSGHNCWGISNGPGTGKILSDLVLGKLPDCDISELLP